MALLTKELIVATNDAVDDIVSVPEWGGDVRVRSLSGAERTELRLKGEGAPSWDAMVCALGIIDEKGVNLFTVTETITLAKKHPLVLERIAQRILELSTLTAEARAEAAKKRAATQTSGGGSSSLEQSTPATE